LRPAHSARARVNPVTFLRPLQSHLTNRQSNLRGEGALDLLERLRLRLRRELFQPSWLSLALGSDYIVRRGLFLAIKSFSASISGHILDFGCGSKPYQDLFSQASSYLGIDLEITGHDHKDSKIDVFYDGKVLPFADGRFDAVVSFEVFEHIFDIRPILKEISRVTRESGYLLISIPFAYPEHEAPYDFARYTSFGIEHLLKEAGYDVIALRKTTSHVLASAQMFITYLRPRSPGNAFLRYLKQLCIIFPCMVIAHILDALLPRRYEFFCNIVLLAQKRAPGK
jgi:SAM-dependent methyltransferase